MSIFGFYFINNILIQAGWPKRRSFFSSEPVVDSLIVDTVVDQMIDWSATLGACRPKSALSMITLMFEQKNLLGENAPSIVDSCEVLKDQWLFRDDESAPHEILQTIRFSDHGKVMSGKIFNEKDIRVSFEQYCFEGLLLGLSCPNHFKSWYKNKCRENRELLPEMKRAGLAVDPLSTLSEWVEECEEILEDYVREFGPLPSIPTNLYGDARVLNLNFDD